MWAGWIEAAATPAGHKNWAIERLNVLFDVPGLAGSQGLATMQAGLAITSKDQAFGISKATGRTMPWLFGHGVPPPVESSHGMIARRDVIARQPGPKHPRYCENLYQKPARYGVLTQLRPSHLAFTASSWETNDNL